MNSNLKDIKEKNNWYESRSLNDLERELLFILSDMLRLVGISWRVIEFNRCIIFSNWKIFSVDYKEWYHRNLPDGLFSWYEFILDNWKKILYLQWSSVEYELERLGILLSTDDEDIEVITENTLFNILNRDIEKKNYFYDLFNKAQRIENIIINKFKNNKLNTKKIKENLLNILNR